ncbi:MAG: hypothetical protein IMY72_01955 [Bacteroidetes bacterium]|nr:hypothetical protein [Bacteroidota bacterium]
MQSQLWNIKQICEDLDTNYHQKKPFILEFNSEFGEVINKIAVELSLIMPIIKVTALIINESGWVKKGNKSFGVGWQYS